MIETKVICDACKKETKSHYKFTRTFLSFKLIEGAKLYDETWHLCNKCLIKFLDMCK